MCHMSVNPVKSNLYATVSSAFVRLDGRPEYDQKDGRHGGDDPHDAQHHGDLALHAGARAVALLVVSVSLDRQNDGEDAERDVEADENDDSQTQVAAWLVRDVL